mmetsp:Transcript_18744/g.47032  ORF Transcript_18744/g.47032 Transcript_18744/m.47032 type:complete len:102 (-) Transcript_18744:54-359(-)
MAREARHLIGDLGDCSAAALAALPRLTFVFNGGRAYDVHPTEYVEISPIDPSRCRLQVQAIDRDDSLVRTAILGQSFLLDRYALFDQAGLRVGLAPLRRQP